MNRIYFLFSCFLGFPLIILACQSKENDVNFKPGQEVEYEISKGVKMKFCWIPAGQAQLGSPKEEQDYVISKYFGGERPKWMDDEAEANRGIYKTKGFWLAKYPVTQEEYKSVQGKNPSFYSPTGVLKAKVNKNDTSHFPVENVSWKDCLKFVEKLNERSLPIQLKLIFGAKVEFALPHEDEWEYACRGGLGNKRPFYFGKILNGEQANSDGFVPYGTDKKGPSLMHISEVGAYEKVSPHPWGLCDMCGNVGQWCNNFFGESGMFPVIRNGYGGPAYSCRSAFRTGESPSDHSSMVGFRIAVVPK